MKALPPDFANKLQVQAQAGLMTYVAPRGNVLYFSVPAAEEGEPTGTETTEFMEYLLSSDLYRWLKEQGYMIMPDTLPTRDCMTDLQLEIADEFGLQSTKPLTMYESTRNKAQGPMKHSPSTPLF